jgi:hypothetical protein
MSPEVRSIISQLERFVPDENEDNSFALNQLLSHLPALADRHFAIEPMFRLMEKFPEADLGSPGPLVHEIEAMPSYAPQLLSSLARRPTNLSVWMVNRILNATITKADRLQWLEQLRLAASHPAAPPAVQAGAREFLAFQGVA